MGEIAGCQAHIKAAVAHNEPAMIRLAIFVFVDMICIYGRGRK
jgi:hypothetical protein